LWAWGFYFGFLNPYQQEGEAKLMKEDKESKQEKERDVIKEMDELLERLLDE
jgi:hypothetical protein